MHSSALLGPRLRHGQRAHATPRRTHGGTKIAAPVGLQNPASQWARCGAAPGRQARLPHGVLTHSLTRL
eukprot:5773399-Lingulodinium_polyedra.AAC.1